MYKIFDYIPIKVRRHAASLRYVENDTLDPRRKWGFVDPRTADGFCPLAACLRELGAPICGSPRVHEVLDAMLTGYGLKRANKSNEKMMYVHIFEFMSDWNYGRASNLREAMGIE